MIYGLIGILHNYKMEQFSEFLNRKAVIFRLWEFVYKTSNGTKTLDTQSYKVPYIKISEQIML